MADRKLKVGQSDLLCRNGCGFFGNPEWSWYCSQCWRKQNSHIQSYNFDSFPGGGSSTSPAYPTSVGSSTSPAYSTGGGPTSLPYSTPPTSQSQSLPTPLNKERSSPFSSMIGRSPGLERKLKLPSPQHVAAGITNKMNQTKRLHSQTLDKSSSNIRQIFKKNPTRKDEKEKTEPLSTEAKLVSKEFGEFLSARVKKSGMTDLSKNIQNFIEKVNKRVEILPIEDIAAMVQDFYQALTNRLQTHEHFHGLSQEEMVTIEDYTERYIMISLYKQLFSPVSTGDEEKDLEIQSKIRSLNWVTASHLDCPFRETDPDIRDLIYTAINHVLEVDGSKAPQDKLRSIVSCSKTIFSILGSSGKGPASADDFLPSLIYILMKANPPRVTSNINFITRFTNERRLRSGEEGYYFTNLCCAISFIENLTATSLNLPEEEFKLYMSGECIPPGSWETSLLMCEGIQTMSHNLKTLSELTELQEKILREAENLEQEMKGWEETLKTEVEAVLSRTQYTIRGPKKPIAPDCEVQEDLSLPPPLLPQPIHPPDQESSQAPLMEEYLESGQDTSKSGSPSNFLQERSLIDQTPTEEQLPSPLLPDGSTQLSSQSSLQQLPTLLQPSPAESTVQPPPDPAEMTSQTDSSSAAAARPYNPNFSNYIGFSAQAFSIPSISCSTAESSASPLSFTPSSTSSSATPPSTASPSFANTPEPSN